MKLFELNELPQYSRWVVDLLGDKASKKVKNEQQIQREFGREKWGSLLAKWKTNPCGIADVKNWSAPSNLLLPGLIKEQLMLMTLAESHILYVDLIEDELLDDSSKNLIEIGCGFGAVLFELMGRGRINYDSVMGLEYTDQGIELAKNLANWHGFDVKIGKGDFNVAGISNLVIKPSSDILTSYSFHYVHDSALALRNIINLKPRRVIHFEPIFHHFDDQTILGTLQQKYMQLNDYTLSHYQELMNLSVAGEIEIIKEVPLIFGSNCLLPASVIVWRPT